MKVAVITTVTVLVVNDKLRLNGLPNKFIGCFTKPPNKVKLKDAIIVKANMQGLTEQALSNVMKVVDELPTGELGETTSTESGVVKIFKTEPLFQS